MQSEFSYCLHSPSAYTDLWPQYPNILSVNHNAEHLPYIYLFHFVCLCLVEIIV